MEVVHVTWSADEARLRSAEFQRIHTDLGVAVIHEAQALAREAQAKGDPVAAVRYFGAALQHAVSELEKQGEKARIKCIGRILQDLVESASRPGPDPA